MFNNNKTNIFQTSTTHVSTNNKIKWLFSQIITAKRKNKIIIIIIKTKSTSFTIRRLKKKNQLVYLYNLNIDCMIFIKLINNIQ